MFYKVVNDILNTDKSFTQIANEYGIARRTVIRINYGETHKMLELNYPLRDNKNKKVIKNFCIDCGVEINRGAIRCTKCAQIKSRNVERPSREELKKLIREKSFVKIGEIYKVSDNTIRKWCIAEKLPSKKTEIKKYTDIE